MISREERREAIERDQDFQPDPYLQEGRASPGHILLTAAAAVTVVLITLYGMTHQPREAPLVASGPAPQTTGAAPADEAKSEAPPPAGKDAQKKDAQKAEQKKDAAQKADQKKDAAPAATTGAASGDAPKEQQPATARPQEGGAQRN